MFNKVLGILFVAIFFVPGCLAEYSSYDFNSEDVEYIDQSDKISIFDKIKNTFKGQPTGYTPQIIEPSPYINTFGPSYMRGFYGSNGWNSHNSFNPIYTGAGVKIID